MPGDLLQGEQKPAADSPRQHEQLSHRACPGVSWDLGLSELNEASLGQTGTSWSAGTDPAPLPCSLTGWATLPSAPPDGCPDPLQTHLGPGE